MRLKVMDSTAVSLCMENNMPIVVLNFWLEDSVKNFLLGEPIGTIIGP
jgi:uridylate kinase